MEQTLINHPLNTVAIAVISFLAGNVSGFVIAKIIAKAPLKLDAEGRINLLIGIVSFAWIASVIVDIVSLNYETSPLVHGIMGAIVGFFFWRPKTQ